MCADIRKLLSVSKVARNINMMYLDYKPVCGCVMITLDVVAIVLSNALAKWSSRKVIGSIQSL